MFCCFSPVETSAIDLELYVQNGLNSRFNIFSTYGQKLEQFEISAGHVSDRHRAVSLSANTVMSSQTGSDAIERVTRRTTVTNQAAWPPASLQCVSVTAPSTTQTQFFFS